MKQSWKKIVLDSVFSVSMAVIALWWGAATISASTTATYLVSTNTSKVAFGNVELGESSIYKVILTNRGSSGVRISQVNTSGAEFKTSSARLPFTLAAGQKAIFVVTFAPTKAGSVTGSVTVVSNATNSPSKASLSGTGVQPEITAIPGSVSFGNVPIGMANTQTVTVSNQGSVKVNLTQIAANGAGFSVSGLQLPASIAPNHTLAFTLRFAPLKAGAITGSVAISSTAINPLLPVPVTGSGVAGVLQLSADTSTLNFGGVDIGGTVTKTVKLTNTGNDKISVSGIVTSGTEFKSSGYAVPLTLAAGQSTSFQVEFAPKTSGNATGSVRVTSTASNSPDTIALSGIGQTATQHSVLLTWAPSSSRVAGYHIYRGAQSSGPFTRLSSSVVPGTTYTDATVHTHTSYFYVATAVDAAGVESSYSNEISVVVH